MPDIETAVVPTDTIKAVPSDSISVIPTQETTATADTLAADTTTILAADSAALRTPQKRQSRLRMEKVDIDSEVDFTAKDSLVMLGQDIANMYGKSEIQYGKQMNISAETIKMDMPDAVLCCRYVRRRRLPLQQR